MRGKAAALDHAGVESGITPAYAGKSVQEGSVFMIYWDHPRLCGEKQLLSSLIQQGIGSPPPMRGKVFIIFCALAVFRITPAYAGKRHILRRPRCTDQDHPRLCGEKFSLTAAVPLLAGSPPPMRGKGTSRS